MRESPWCLVVAAMALVSSAAIMLLRRYRARAITVYLAAGMVCAAGP